MTAKAIIPKQILIYAGIGVLGFCVEAIILTELVNTGRYSPTSARLVSFPIAVLVTWYLNRLVTFNSKAKILREATKYFASQCVGAAANLGMYLVCIQAIPYLNGFPVIALGIGAGVGLIVNYGLSIFWVFRRYASHG